MSFDRLKIDNLACSELEITDGPHLVAQGVKLYNPLEQPTPLKTNYAIRAVMRENEKRAERRASGAKKSIFDPTEPTDTEITRDVIEYTFNIERIDGSKDEIVDLIEKLQPHGGSNVWIECFKEDKPVGEIREDRYFDGRLFIGHCVLTHVGGVAWSDSDDRVALLDVQIVNSDWFFYGGEAARNSKRWRVLFEEAKGT